MQVDPIKPTFKAPGSKLLKLKCDVLLSNCAFKFNLSRCNQIRKTFIRACQRAVMIMHEPKVGFTLIAHTVPSLR